MKWRLVNPPELSVRLESLRPERGDEDVQPALEFSRTVVGGQHRREAPQQWNLPRRQPVQSESQKRVRLILVLEHGPKFVEDVTIQEAAERAIGSKLLGVTETCAGQQIQEVLERSQGARRPQRARSRPRAALVARRVVRHHPLITRRRTPGDHP